MSASTITALLDSGQIRPVNNHYNVLEKKTLTTLLRPIPMTSHKNDFGHVLIMEGDPRLWGASRLCARAVLRVGAGMVTLAVERLREFAPFDLAEFMRIERDQIGKDFIKKIDALVIGPGLGQDPYWQRGARELLGGIEGPLSLLVIDADGLRLFREPTFMPKVHTVVATPHPGEAAHLLGCSIEEIENNRFLAIERLARMRSDIDITWVLKGANTLVRSVEGDIFAFTGELPLLAAGGSGDVLSGTIAGLFRQTSSVLAAVLLAVSLQIEAALVLSKTIFKGSLASELADALPQLLQRKNR